MTKHTPGPWHVGKYNGVYNADGHSVLSLIPQAEAEANSRLIAAAPDLLEAAKAALEIIESWNEKLPKQGKQLRAAIAKAEGK